MKTFCGSYDAIALPLCLVALSGMQSQASVCFSFMGYRVTGVCQHLSLQCN